MPDGDFDGLVFDNVSTPIFGDDSGNFDELVLGDDSSNFDELVLDDGDFDSYKFDPSVFVLTADFLDLRGILADFAYITKRYGLEATTR